MNRVPKLYFLTEIGEVVRDDYTLLADMITYRSFIPNQTIIWLVGLRGYVNDSSNFMVKE